MKDLDEHLEQLGYSYTWDETVEADFIRRAYHSRKRSQDTKFQRAAEATVGARQGQGRAALCRKCGDRGVIMVRCRGNHWARHRPMICGCGVHA